MVRICLPPPASLRTFGSCSHLRQFLKLGRDGNGKCHGALAIDFSQLRSEPEMAPDLITVRGHRRPRLYRSSTIHR